MDLITAENILKSDIDDLPIEELGKPFLYLFHKTVENTKTLQRGDTYIEDVINRWANRDYEKSKILCEVVRWLSNHGYVAEYLYRGQDRIYFVTRAGHKYLEGK